VPRVPWWALVPQMQADPEIPSAPQRADPHVPSPPERGGAPSPAAWWRGLPARTRRRIRIGALCGLAFVLVGSVLLARFLSVENAERDDDLALIEAEARGDAKGMLARLDGCASRPACVATVQANARNPNLRRPGAVKILQLTSATAYSLNGATGKTRLAWTVIGKLPVVQCIEVRRSGSFVTGMSIHLLSLSAPIPGEADC
jgi:hypothetical protein